MKTRTRICGSISVVLLGALTLLGNAQEPRPKLRTARPIKSRLRQTTPPRRQAVRHKPADANRVHRFDELFDQQAQPATPAPVALKKEVAEPAELQEPGLLPAINAPTNVQPEDSVVAPVGGLNPFVDDPESRDEIWRLEDVEPMVMNRTTGQYLLGAPQLEPLTSGSTPMLRVVRANQIDTGQPRRIQPVQGEASRWRNTTTAAPNDGRGWVNSPGRTTGGTRPRSLRRGLKRPARLPATNARPTQQSGNSHWASESSLFPATAREQSTPQQLQPVPTRTQPKGQNAIDNSWYDDFESPRSKPRPSRASVRNPVRPQPPAPARTNWVPARTMSMSRTIDAPRLTSDRSAMYHPQAVTITATPMVTRREAPLEPYPNIASQQSMTKAERMSAIRRRSGLTGFKGFCPVQLCDNRQLSDSRPEFFTNYRNRTYYFSSRTAKSRFDADPTRYAPAAQGHDVVQLVKSGARTPGQLDHCCWHEQVLYMFATAESLAAFQSQPWEYVSRY